jgi:phosphate starvation-inducible PhoH-like protein
VARFSDTDVVRHPLVAEIVRAYDARDRARSEARDAYQRRDAGDVTRDDSVRDATRDDKGPPGD